MSELTKDERWMTEGRSSRPVPAPNPSRFEPREQSTFPSISTPRPNHHYHPPHTLLNHAAQTLLSTRLLSSLLLPNLSLHPNQTLLLLRQHPEQQRARRTPRLTEQLPERHTAAREARGLLHGVPGCGGGIAVYVCGCGGELCEFPPCA
jgi:hypothetical protein